MSDEDLEALWRQHTKLGDRDSFERWARAAERQGLHAGMELVRAGRRWDRIRARCTWLRAEITSREEATLSRVRIDDALESAEAAAVRLYERARRATRALRREGRLPQCSANKLELHVLGVEVQRLAARDALLAGRLPRFERMPRYFRISSQAGESSWTTPRTDST